MYNGLCNSSILVDVYTPHGHHDIGDRPSNAYVAHQHHGGEARKSNVRIMRECESADSDMR